MFTFICFYPLYQKKQQELSVVTILTSSCSRPPSREAISLVCEALPGTKGALRKKKVHGWTGGGRDGGRKEKGEEGRDGDAAIATPREPRKGILLNGTVERGRGNGIRYSFTRPRSIFSGASVTTSSLALPVVFFFFLKRKTENRKGACTGWGEMERYGAVCAWASHQPTMHCTPSTALGDSRCAQYPWSGACVCVCVYMVCEETVSAGCERKHY